jgi:hypothetical protein
MDQKFKSFLKSKEKFKIIYPNREQGKKKTNCPQDNFKGDNPELICLDDLNQSLLEKIIKLQIEIESDGGLISDEYNNYST